MARPVSHFHPRVTDQPGWSLVHAAAWCWPNSMHCINEPSKGISTCRQRSVLPAPKQATNVRTKLSMAVSSSRLDGKGCAGWMLHRSMLSNVRTICRTADWTSLCCTAQETLPHRCASAQRLGRRASPMCTLDQGGGRDERGASGTTCAERPRPRWSGAGSDAAIARAAATLSATGM